MNNHEWHHGQLQHLTCCPICKSSLIEKTYKRHDDELSFPDIWTMNSCVSCEGIYLNPRPDSKSLPLAYEKYYTHSEPEITGGKTRSSLVDRLINGYLNIRFNIEREHRSLLGGWFFSLAFPFGMQLDVHGRNIPKKLCKQGTQLLDVGCGNGDFLLRAQEMGINATGLEFDPVAAEKCQHLGLNVLVGSLESAEFKPDTFDYITLNHVIEHVDQPQTMLSELYVILKPDGALWLGLPNPNALGVRVFGAGWKGFHPPFHLTIPSQKTLERWLVDAGFENVKFIRRGIQSKGLWSESENIAARDGKKISHTLSTLYRYAGNLLSVLTHRYAEETIVIARKPRK